MARGTTRAPSLNAYRGSVGKTQTATVHVTGPRGDLMVAEVHTTIDAVSDPALVERLFASEADDATRVLNVVRPEGAEAIRVPVPVVYHDPAAELLVLVLGDAHRHREIEERIALLERMRADVVAIPAYAKEFAVVYGPAGLRALLEARAQAALSAARGQDSVREVERRMKELAEREAEVTAHARAAEERGRGIEQQRAREFDRRATELDDTKRAIDRLRLELDGDRADLDRAHAELERLRAEARHRVINALSSPTTPTTPAPATPAPAPLVAPAPTPDLAHATAPVHLHEHDDDDDEITNVGGVPRLAGDATVISPSPAASPPPVTAPVVATPATEAVDAARAARSELDTGPVPREELIGEGAASVAATVISPAPGTTIAAVEAPAPAREPERRAGPEAAPPAPRSIGPAAPAGGVPTAPKAVPAGSGPISTLAAAIYTHALSGEVEVEFDEETSGASIIPQGADPLTAASAELPLEAVADDWLDRASTADTSTITLGTNGVVRLALIAGDRLARGLGGPLDVRVLLHRTDHGPVVVLVVGPPSALRVASTTQLVVVPLDIALDGHRAVLTALGRSFDLIVELVVRGKRIRRVRLTAPLAENVAYIVRAADDHLRGLAAADDGVVSFERARTLVIGSGFDLLGAEHPDLHEFSDDKLAQLETAQHLRRAIAMARRFARPAREDYLVCTRGFPLLRWRELRRHVLESAVAWGLWMGPELAQVAVSEGLARSRRDLVIRLDRGFDALRKHPTAFDIDTDAADDNFNALAEEARALGVELKASKPPATGQTMTSEEASEVSGSIGVTPPGGSPRPKTIDELVTELDDRNRRVAAALELCERGEGSAAAAVVAAVSKMSRSEAVRVLGMSVKFGAAAAAPLMEGLKSSKSFLRHGCALALVLVRTDVGTQAVIELLLEEPTEIWREVARAVGQLGPSGLAPLASNYGRLGDRATPQVLERVAWAMAHIAVRGGKPAVELMSGGTSVVAAVARHALELHASAAQDHVRVRPGGDGPGRDVTVNRAFSRRFFEALEQGRPEAAAAELEALDASSPMELLDESDLLEEESAEVEVDLDDADLIQA